MKMTNAGGAGVTQKHIGRSARKPLLAVMAGALALAFTVPVQAASELEMLKQELEQQRKLLDQQQKVIERLEQKFAEQAASRPAAEAKAAQAPAGKPAGETPLLTIYGILDGGVEHITNIGADGDNLTRVPGITGTMPSRLGFRVNKEFKPGFSGIGTLEAGFNLDDGTQGQGGRIFGRQIFAGLQTPYGAFTFGRQYSMLLPAIAASDLLGPNIYAMGSVDAYLPNARFDNSLAWRHKVGKVSFGATYSFGRDTAGGVPASGTCGGEQNEVDKAQACRGWSAMLRYDAGSFGLAAAIDEQRGGKGATAFFFNGAAPIAFTGSSDKDRRINAGGYVKFGKTTVGLGWLGREVDTAAADVRSDAFYLTGSYDLSDVFRIDGGIHRITNDDQDRDATLVVLRGLYTIDKGLTAYAQVGHIANSKNASYALSGAGGGTAPAAGENQNGYMIGMRYMF